MGPAFIECRTDGTGRFRFIAVEGYADVKHAASAVRGPRAEFTWEGDDDDSGFRGVVAGDSD